MGTLPSVTPPPKKMHVRISRPSKEKHHELISLFQLVKQSNMTTILVEFVLVHVRLDGGNRYLAHKSTGDTLLMEVDLETTTISDCANWISDQIQRPRHYFAQVSLLLGDYGRHIYQARGHSREFRTILDNDDDDNKTSDKDFLRNYLCHDRPIVVRFEATSQPVILNLRYYDTSMRTIRLPLMFQNSPILDIKNEIWSSLHISPDAQRLCNDFEERLPDADTLSRYEIESGCTLHVMQEQTGGGCAFVDVTQSSALRTDSWNEDAPRWREVEPGLCLEGICRNPACCAYREMVVANMEFQNLDLAKKPKVCCPMCRHQFQPIKPGFNHCFWKISAVKKSSPESVFHTPWKRTGDEYTTYDEAAAGMSVFTRLQIFVRPLHMKNHHDSPYRPKKPRVSPVPCSICLKEVQGYYGHTTPSGCQHVFHDDCWESWKDKRTTKGKEPTTTCPICCTA